MFKPSTIFEPVTVNADALEYHEIGKDVERGDPSKVMSRGELLKFAKCPSKWMHGEPDKKTEARRWGSLFDCLILMPHRFEKDYVIQPDKYRAVDGKESEQKPWNNNATVCKKWNADQAEAGKEIVHNDDVVQARIAANRLYAVPYIAAFLKNSDHVVQIMVDWHDEATGLIVPFKCLVDILHHFDEGSDEGRAVADLKTARSAEYRDWTRAVFQDDLYYQAALYKAATNAATGKDYKMFKHIISENTAPYEPAHRFLTMEFLQLGAACFDRDIRLYCQCLKENRWPGYDSHWVDPEPWMLNKI